MAPSQSKRILDQIISASNMEPVKKVVTLSSGLEIEMYVSPRTAAESDKAKSQARAANNGVDSDWLIYMLVSKAKGSDTRPLFAAAEIDILKTQMPEDDLNLLIAAVYGMKDENIGNVPKSRQNSEKTDGQSLD